MLKEKTILGTVAYMGGVPAVLEEFCWSWGNMLAYNMENLCNSSHTIYYTKATKSFHSHARNELVSNMLGEWLFMLDTDHTFEPDILERMLHVMDVFNLPILSGIYASKDESKSPIIYGINPTSLGSIETFANVLTWPKESFLIQVDGAGGGCLLVKRGVFEKIRNELRESPFDIIPPYGEDLSFFMRLKKLNIPSFCCPLIEAKHLTIQPVSVEDRLIPHSLLSPTEQITKKTRKEL